MINLVNHTLSTCSGRCLYQRLHDIGLPHTFVIKWIRTMTVASDSVGTVWLLYQWAGLWLCWWVVTLNQTCNCGNVKNRWLKMGSVDTFYKNCKNSKDCSRDNKSCLVVYEYILKVSLHDFFIDGESQIYWFFYNRGPKLFYGFRYCTSPASSIYFVKLS